MASKKRRSGADIRQPILIVYVGICVIAVVFTVVIAFSESNNTGQISQSTPTRTLAPYILTQRAEGSVNQDENPGQKENSETSTVPGVNAKATPEH